MCNSKRRIAPESGRTSVREDSGAFLTVRILAGFGKMEG